MIDVVSRACIIRNIAKPISKKGTSSMKKNLEPKHDYSKYIAEKKKESQYESFSTFIAEKIHDCREKYYAGEARSFNRSTLADMIGIDSSTLTKIINGSQATRKRDIIIALCFALCLSESETKQALDLYPMAPLNPNNLRDLVIIQALYDRVSVKELNETLADHGFTKLNVLRGDRRNDERAFYVPLDATAFEEVSVQVLPYCIAGDDSELSLHDRYRPDRYNFHGEMIIQEKNKDSSQYRISIDGIRQYEIEIRESEGWKLLYGDEHFQQKYDGVRTCDNAELLNEITKLKGYIDSKARHVHSMCNDTRNYGSRFDAVNEHGRLVVYGEVFGFGAPELSEYFQLQASADGCLFTVSNTSRFLERYLGEKDWKELYGISPSQIIRKFTTLDEVTNQRWREQFQALLQSACDLLDQLRAHKLFIFNARAWLDVDEIMHIFHVEEAFECYQPDDSPYEIVPKKNQIIGTDGKPVTIDDLYQAAEMDITTLEELCTIRNCYGSLEQFLQINPLTEQKGKIYE